MGLVNIDEQQYRALPLMNQSAIKHGMRSMAHMKAYMDGEIKFTSDALSLGSLVHAVVLEEEYFSDMYAIMPKIDRRTKAGKQAYEDFLAVNADREICKEEDWETAMKMRESVWSHPAAAPLLKRKGKAEQTITWNDPDSGIDCKGRIDLLLEGKGRQKPMIVDLKTTQDAGPDFAKALLKFGGGLAIDNDDQALWLAVHGANCYGYDKVSLDDRYQWCLDNIDKIKRTVEDPYGYKWWTEADEPWQFLAFCYEWSNFEAKGYGFL